MRGEEGRARLPSLSQMAVPLVSVIVPTRNRPEETVRAVASVLSQTVDDIEVIVVDDASTDHTRDAVRSIPDDRVQLLRHPEQRGGAAARNTGLEQAAAKIVAFLDSDDEWYPKKLELQLPLFEDQALGAAFSDYDVLVADRRLGTAHIEFPSDGRVYEKLLSGWCPAMMSVCIIRKEVIDQAGRFDDSLSGYQDFDLWLRVAPLCRFASVSAPLAVVYTGGDDRLSSSLDSRSAALDRFLEKWSLEMEQVVGAGTTERVRHHQSVNNLAAATTSAAHAGNRGLAFRHLVSLGRLDGPRATFGRPGLLVQVTLGPQWHTRLRHLFGRTDLPA